MIVVGLVLVLAGTSCSSTRAPDSDSTGSLPHERLQGDPLAGAPVYRGVCATCHGIDLDGVEGLGGPLVPSAFIATRSDDELVAFIIEGRPIGHPDNITGVAMFPRGGNPALSDQDIADIVAYIKARQ